MNHPYEQMNNSDIRATEKTRLLSDTEEEEEDSSLLSIPIPNFLPSSSMSEGVVTSTGSPTQSPEVSI